MYVVKLVWEWFRQLRGKFPLDFVSANYIPVDVNTRRKKKGLLAFAPCRTILLSVDVISLLITYLLNPHIGSQDENLNVELKCSFLFFWRFLSLDNPTLYPQSIKYSILYLQTKWGTYWKILFFFSINICNVPKITLKLLLTLWENTYGETLAITWPVCKISEFWHSAQNGHFDWIEEKTRRKVTITVTLCHKAQT